MAEASLIGQRSLFCFPRLRLLIYTKAVLYISYFNSGYVPVTRRIHIIGSTGSGKTYVARLLSRRLSIPTFDLDDLFWDRSASTYGVRATGDVRDRKLAEIVNGDAWIIEGMYHLWVGPSFDRAEVILALTPSVWVRDARVIRRFIKRKLGLVPSKRESLRDLWQLLQWNHNYDHDNHPRAMAFIRECGRFDVLLTIGLYEMSERNTPGVGSVLAAAGVEAIPEAHCYLTYDGQRYDFTGLLAGQLSPFDSLMDE